MDHSYPGGPRGGIRLDFCVRGYTNREKLTVSIPVSLKEGWLVLDPHWYKVPRHTALPHLVCERGADVHYVCVVRFT